ncbi:MAG TPA: hypothetical protein VNU25_03725 [Candidatus Paceibacterota bacterium]|nr:hypothetical protein [Candidatus Paceibacterota bacterium]
MNTKVAWIAVVVIVALALIWFFSGMNRAAAPTESSATTDTATSSEPVAPAPVETDKGTLPAATVVTLTDAGFSPASVTVSAGQTVRFVNDSSRSMWIGADEHPTHTEYDGTSTREHCVEGAAVGGAFDQCQAVPRGASWEFTFTKAGTFGFHNHTGASSVGTVIVR